MEWLPSREDPRYHEHRFGAKYYRKITANFLWGKGRLSLHPTCPEKDAQICPYARLAWLPRQANRLLHGGWYRTWKTCHWPWNGHWPWNVKSTVRKARSSPTQNWIIFLENWWPLTTSQFTFLHCTIRLRCSQIAGMAWKNSSGTLLLERLQLQPWQPCRSQIFHCMVAGIELEQYATDKEMSN